MTDTKHTDSVEAIVQEANKRLSSMEHAVLEAGEADAFLNWLRTTLQAQTSQQVEEAVREERERIIAHLITCKMTIDTVSTRREVIPAELIWTITPNHQD